MHSCIRPRAPSRSPLRPRSLWRQRARPRRSRPSLLPGQRRPMSCLGIRGPRAAGAGQSPIAPRNPAQSPLPSRILWRALRLRRLARPGQGLPKNSCRRLPGAKRYRAWREPPRPRHASPPRWRLQRCPAWQHLRCLRPRPGPALPSRLRWPPPGWQAMCPRRPHPLKSRLPRSESARPQINRLAAGKCRQPPSWKRAFPTVSAQACPVCPPAHDTPPWPTPRY